MGRGGRFWAAYLLGGLIYDVLCDRRRDDSTLSSVTRRVVAATPGGKVVLALGLVWFWDHIVAPLADLGDEAIAAAGIDHPFDTE